MKKIFAERFNDLISLLIDSKLIASKTEAAEALGISKSKLSEILNYRMMPGIDLFATLVHKFGVNPSWIMTGSGSALLSAAMVTQNGNVVGNVASENPSSSILYKEEIISALKISEKALRESSQTKDEFIDFLKKEIGRLESMVTKQDFRISELKDELSSEVCSECRKKRKAG